jgi:hypothetical protein
MLVVIDVSGITTSEALQQLLASSLGFPGYYGRNWDAFWDCVTDPSQSAVPTVLRVTGWEVLAVRLPRDAALMRECLSELPTRRSDCTVEWAPARSKPCTTPVAPDGHGQQS